MTSTEQSLPNSQASTSASPTNRSSRPSHSRASSSSSSISSSSSKPRRVLAPNIPARKTSNSASPSPSSSAPGTPQSLPWMNSANKPTAAGIAQALQERAKQLREKEQELARSQGGNGALQLPNGENYSNDDSMDSSITTRPTPGPESLQDGNGIETSGGLSPTTSGRESVSTNGGVSEASTPKANPLSLPKSNPTSPTTPLPSSPLRAQDPSQTDSRERPISTASTASRYSATGWDDYQGVVQSMDWGAEGGGGGVKGTDGIGEIVIGGPQRSSPSVESSPGIPIDEAGNESERERSKTPTLIHSSNPSTSSSSSATSSNQPIQDSEMSRILKHSSVPQTPSRSPDPDSVSVADTDMLDYADLADNEEGGSTVQLMTATKIAHPSPQSASLVGTNSFSPSQSLAKSENISKTIESTASKRQGERQQQPLQGRTQAGMVGLGLGMSGKGSPSTATTSDATNNASFISRSSTTAASPENVTATFSSPTPQAQSSEKSDRPSTGGSHGSFGTAKTSFSPSAQQHNESQPIGLGLGSPVTIGNGHSVSDSSTGTSTEVSPQQHEAISPSISSPGLATPFSTTSASSGGSSPSRRKGRPAALKLSESTSSPSSSPAAASGTFTSSRSLSSLASPKSRSNHPPPTNPPAEPLPPLPPTPSLRQNKSVNNGLGTMSPSNSSPQNQFNSSRLDQKSPEEQKVESPRRSSAGAIQSPTSLVTGGDSLKKAHSRSQSQGAAAALRNHAATDAATSHAQEVLKAVETPLTFNEKNKRREIGLVATPSSSGEAGEPTSTDMGQSMVGLSGNKEQSESRTATEDAAKNPSSESDEDEDLDAEVEEVEVAVLKTLTHAPVRQSVDGNRTEKSSSSSESSHTIARSPSGAIPVGRATVTRVNSKDFHRNPSVSASPKANLSSNSNSNDSDIIKPPRASLENLGNSRIVREATERLNGSQRNPSGENLSKEGAESRSVTVGQLPGPRRPIIHSRAQDPPAAKVSNSSSTISHQSSNSASSLNRVSNANGERSDARRSVIAQPASWPASASNTDTSQPSTPAFDERASASADSALDDSSENHQTADTVIASPLPANSSNASASGAPNSAANANQSNRPPMVRRRSSAASLMSNRRLEMEEDRNRAESTQSLDPLTLKRTEGRFTGAFGETVKAFKQLQAEKRALERVIRETTPLEGLGDGEGLGRYLQSMSDKLRMSSSEISQLLDLLEQQRAVMDYMLETHELERDQLLDEIDDLRDALIQIEATALSHKSNAEKLTEDLEKAYAEGVAARAETLKAKAAVKEEEGKRDKYLELLNLEKKKVEDLEKRHEDFKKEHEATRGQISVDGEKTKADISRLESEKESLSRSHERALRELQTKHSEEIKQLNSKHDKTLLDYRKKVEKDSEELKNNHEKDLEDFAEHVTELEDQINAHVEEKSQLFVEIESRKLQVTNINQQLQKAFAELAERGSEDSASKSQTSWQRKSLEDQLQNHVKEKKNLEDKISQLNSLHQSRLNELFEEKESLKKTHESEKSDLQLVIDSKMQEFAGIREEVANVKASHANDAEELEAMRESYEKLESEKEELLEKLGAKEEELERLSKLQTQNESVLPAASSPAALSPFDLPSADREARSSISSDRSDQIFTAAERKELLATLAEQRTRETQIRTAYKQLRDELRKTQAAAQQNKRNTGSFISFGGPNAPLASPALSTASYPMSDGGHGGMPPSPGQSSLLSQGNNGSGTSRQLKRLSLPLVQTKPKNGNGPVSWQDLFRPDSASSTASNPPSSYQYRSGSISSSLGGLGSSGQLHSKSNSSAIEGTSSSPEPTHGETDENMRNRLGLNDSPETERENQREEIESLRSPALSQSSLDH